MPRTTSELVQEIIAVNVEIALDPFILAAGVLVNRVAEDTGSPDEDVLTIIETWLAAHFYAIRDPRRLSERAGDVWATFESKVDLHLNVTRYGQMALVLDPTGTLAAISNAAKDGPRLTRTVGVHWIGTDCPEEE